MREVISHKTKTKIIENDNLLSFMVELYKDKKNIGCNTRLLSECLVEWQNTNLEIKNNNDHLSSEGSVGPALGIWNVPDTFARH